MRKLLTFFTVFLMLASARGTLALQCCGDCDNDSTVTIGELVKTINNFLGQCLPAACPSGLANCAGVCRDLLNDNTNCGTCGTVCAAGRVCSAAACTLSCQSGLTNCGGVCTNLLTDNANCGTCGTVCEAGKGCVNSVCR